MKGRFEASWRIVLALAVVLSLGLMTAAPVMALSLTSVAPLPPTVKVLANYTVTFQPAIAVNTSAYIYVYFPDASATNNPVLTGVTVAMTKIDGVGVTSVSAEKYNVMDAVNNVLKIMPSATVTANASHLLVFGEVTNLCPKGSHTLQIWTDAEKTAVSTTYTLTTDGVVRNITISASKATATACDNVTFTATGYDICGSSLGDVTASITWGDNSSGALTWSVNNVTTCLPIGTWKITGNHSGGGSNTTTLTVTAGPAKYLTYNQAPSSPTNCCDNITAVLNVTDCCYNPVSGVAITASVIPAVTMTGTTSVTTNSSGLAAFKLAICANGTYMLKFTAGSLSVNTTGIVVPTGNASSLVLSPCPKTVVVNTTVTYTAELYDNCGNDLGAAGTVNYTISAGAGANFTGNNITPVECGIWTVTGVLASNASVTGTCALTVTHAACPAPNGLSISPAAATIESGNSQQFIATATDVFGCTWDATTDPGTTWSINLSCAGGMWASLYPGKYVSEHTGCFNVTATLCGVSDTAYLTVTPSMCFIATATYGTPMAQEIQILRAFRDGYLLTNPLGRALVAFYYKTSPPIAQFIAEHPSLKPIVRAMLVPALAMSTIVVHNGVTLPIIILSLVLIAVALAIWATRRQRGSMYA